MPEKAEKTGSNPDAREKRISVALLSQTNRAETAALAAKLCYSAADISSLKDALSTVEQDVFISNIASMGHTSVFEHISFTFGVEGVSRTLTHQLVRHRIASYSQKSQRYVSHDNFAYITPPSVRGNSLAKREFCKAIQAASESYVKLIELGVAKEDARYLLPNACETKIIITMNARELLHFFRLRCCERAQWEIRELAVEMLKLVNAAAPSIFSLGGPACVNGRCSEGKFTCGKAKQVRNRFKQLLKG
ncbi:MAG: FAD-dependent thymidylate synthase [Deferribacteraceae bacterium]|jgi:thymidylate synthase (FAD)|nr:FAD-dependent thymidylate synthase [Deferribacteraceae bacterium]